MARRALAARLLYISIVPSEIRTNTGDGAGNTATPKCHPGDQILGGGGNWLGGGPGLDTDSSAPYYPGGGAWVFSGNDYGERSNMYALAICLKN
jgi:hypothetical protein